VKPMLTPGWTAEPMRGLMQARMLMLAWMLQAMVGMMGGTLVGYSFLDFPRSAR